MTDEASLRARRSCVGGLRRLGQVRKKKDFSPLTSPSHPLLGEECPGRETHEPGSEMEGGRGRRTEDVFVNVYQLEVRNVRCRVGLLDYAQ